MFSVSIKIQNMSSVKWRRRTQSLGTYGSFKQRLEEPVREDDLIEGYAYLCFPKDGSWFRGSLTGSDCTSYALSGQYVQTSVEKDELLLIEKPQVKQHSMDSQMERELQFALEDLRLPQCKGPTSREASPPDSSPMQQQLLKTFEQLGLQDSGNFSSEEKEESSQGSTAASTPSFRSRSGSRSLETFTAKYDIKVTDLDDGSDFYISSVAGRHGQSCTLRSRQLCFVTEKSYWGQRADMMIQNSMAASDLVGQGCHVFAGPAKLCYTRVFPSPSPIDKTYW